LGQLKEKARTHFKVDLSTSSIHRQASSDTSPQKPHSSNKQIIPAEVEEKFAENIRRLRRQKLTFYRRMFMSGVRAIVRGTRYQKFRTHDGLPNYNWYSGFLRRHGLEAQNKRPLEITRARWFTAKNMCKWYNNCADVLVENRLARPNPDFDPSKPLDEMIYIDHPKYMGSMDECGFRIAQKEDDTAKKKEEKTIVDKNTGDNETLATTGGGKITGVGGCCADNRAVPGLFIANTLGLTEELVKTKGPRSTVIGADNRPVESYLSGTKKGGITPKLFGEFITKCFGAAWPIDERPIVNGTRIRPVLFCDGLGGHFADEALDACDALDIDIVLRCPYCSFGTQIEDVTVFPVVKPLFRIAKGKLLIKKWKKKLPLRLNHADGLACIRPAWEKGFSAATIAKGWAKIGMYPAYNRQVYWDLVEAERKQGGEVVQLPDIDPDNIDVDTPLGMDESSESSDEEDVGLVTDLINEAEHAEQADPTKHRITAAELFNNFDGLVTRGAGRKFIDTKKDAVNAAKRKKEKDAQERAKAKKQKTNDIKALYDDAISEHAAGKKLNMDQLRSIVMHHEEEPSKGNRADLIEQVNGITNFNLFNDEVA